MAWFGLFQFANISALLIAAFSPLLIFAYLKKKNRNRKTVSSTLILSSLPKRKVKKQSFKLPPRFFLELLCLLLLSAALAQPSIKDSTKEIALLVDNSLSMRAPISTNETKSRINQAKEEIIDWLSKQNQRSRYTLFSSSPRLKQHGGKSLTQAEVGSLLKKLNASLASDSLSSSAEELSSSGEYDTVLIVSDRAVQMTKELKKKNSQGKISGGSVDNIQVGSSVPNYYINNLRINKETDSSQQKEILASIAYSGFNFARIRVNLQGARKSGKSGKLSYMTLASKPLELKPRKTLDVRLPLPRVLPNGSNDSGIYRVTLEGNTRDLNALEEDDEAWITSFQNSFKNVMLISPQAGPNKNLGLTAISGIQVQTLSPQDFSNLSPSQLKEASLLILHQSAPAFVPKIPTLLILPPTDNPLFPLRPETTSAPISSWADEHPITAYLRVSLLKATDVLLFNPPPWAQKIINVETGPSLLAGENRGIRFAAVGFELLPFEGEKTPVLTVLTLNLINWLSGAKELNPSFTTGGNFPLGEDLTWVLRTPTGKIQTLNTSSTNETRFLPLNKSGIYQLTQIGGRNASELNKNSKIIAVNAFHPRESSTFKAKPLLLKTLPSRSLSKNTETALWPFIVGIVTILLFLEILSFFWPSSLSKEHSLLKRDSKENLKVNMEGA